MSYYIRRGLADDSAQLSPAARVASTGYRVGAVVATPLLVYHGYKRTDSVGWAIAWGLLGGGFWFFGVPLAFAQGFAKRKVRSNKRRRTSRRSR